MASLITEKTTKNELIEDYKNYPPVGGDLDSKPFYEHRYSALFYEIPMGSHVLDVGCNDGIFMEMLRDKRKCNVKGIDVSQIALDEAKKRKLDVRIGDAENIPFPDQTFNVVNCQEVLSHLFDPAKAISEMRRILKKNGILVGSVPHENLQKFAWEDKRMVRKYYTVDELSQLLEKSFKRNWIKSLTGAQFSISLAQSFLASEPCEILFKSGGVDTLGWDSELQDKSILRCWFGFTQSPGTAYYRMSGFADKMQELGAQTHYNPYNENVLNSCSEWSEKIHWVPSQKRFTNQHIVEQIYTLWKASDLTIWQITSSRDVLALLTALRDPLNIHSLHPKKPLLTEMDDWMFDMPSYNLASNPYRPNSEAESVAFDQIKLSDAVITSTEYLKEKIQILFPRKQVYVIKNSLDFKIWDNLDKKTPAHDANPDLVRIIYSGCGNHSGDLEIIKQPILTLLDEFPNLEFITLPFNRPGEVFADVSHSRFLKWDVWVGLSQFPQMALNWEGDIGIAPLRDNELNRSKSNLRWLEYSALKIPTVASNIYPFKMSIKDKKDGFIVGNSSKEWYMTLRALILDKEKRLRIGEAAYREVKKNYSMNDVAKSYLSVLKEIKREFITN